MSGMAHVRVDDLRSSAVVASRGGGQLTFEGLLADVVAVELRSDALPAQNPPWVVRNEVPAGAAPLPGQRRIPAVVATLRLLVDLEMVAVSG